VTFALSWAWQHISDVSFVTLLHPLTDLLKANVKFEWSSACQKAFDKVKRLLTTAPLLKLPDWHNNKPFDMVCDASLKGIA
jgi:hypothetical protein